jgi:hypothetical protein
MIKRALLAGLMGLVVALPVALVAPTAAEARTGNVCTTFGKHWCIGTRVSGIVQPGTVAVNHTGPGRTLVFVAGPGGTDKICLKAEPGLCLAPISGQNRVIAFRLANVYGVLWSWVAARNTHYFVSHRYPGLRLSADNTRNDPLVMCPAGGCAGTTFTLQQWTGPRRN